jgi:hypothetical protein
VALGLSLYPDHLVVRAMFWKLCLSQCVCVLGTATGVWRNPNRKSTKKIFNVSDLVDSAPASPSGGHKCVSPLQFAFKRILAGNPFYLASAGLLLYGINQLTTDPKLVGAEFPMLRFNFCALVVYEIMLVFTAIWP